MALAILAQPKSDDAFDAVTGIDTHRDFHVAVALASNGTKLDEYWIPTSQLGYQALIGWSEFFGNRPIFAM